MNLPMQFLRPSIWMLGLVSIGGAQTQHSAKAAIGIAITAPLDAAKAGEKFPLRLTMTNASGHDIHLHTTYIGSEAYGVLQVRFMDIQIVDSGGNPVAETAYGRTLHRRNGGTEEGKGFEFDWKPGETFREESDLAREFDLSRPGQYTVHAFRADPDEKPAASSNAIRFTVRP